MANETTVQPTFNRQNPSTDDLLNIARIAYKNSGAPGDLDTYSGNRASYIKYAKDILSGTSSGNQAFDQQINQAAEQHFGTKQIAPLTGAGGQVTPQSQKDQPITLSSGQVISPLDPTYKQYLPNITLPTGQVITGLDPNYSVYKKQQDQQLAPARNGQPIEQFTQKIDESMRKPITLPSGQVISPQDPNYDTYAKQMQQGSQGGTQSSQTPPTPPQGPIGTSDQARAAGIAAQKKELAPTTPEPTLYKSSAEYERLRKEQGIVNDEAELNAIHNEQLQGNQELRQFRSTAGQGVTEASRLGAVSEAERNLSFRMEGLAIKEQAALARVNTKNSYINTALQLGLNDYNAALNAYNTEYNKNVKAVELYNQHLNDQQKDALTTISTINNLFKDQGVTYSNLTPALKSQIETAELRAGLPSGTFQAAYNATPHDEIKSTKINDDGSVTIVTENKQTGRIGVKDIAPQGGVRTPKLTEVSPGATLYNPVTGKAVYTAPTARQQNGGAGGGVGYSKEAEAVINGTLKLSDLTPTKRGEIAGELIKAGYKPSINLSPGQQDDLATMGTVRSLIDDIEKYNNDGILEGIGIGFSKGTIGQTISGVFGSGTEEAKSVRALIGNVKATIAKLRGGTSFTPNEEKLLNTYTPTINDHPSVALNKLNLLKDFINIKEQNLYQYAQPKQQSSSAQNKKSEDLRSKYKY